MNPKDILTNEYFCPMPWSGLMYNFDGEVKNCIRSNSPIGNIKHDHITDILSGSTNLDRQNKILNSLPVASCRGCYDLEQGKKNFDIISDRIFYIKELKPINKINKYSVGNFDLETVDVRWSNLCNFACVYCGPAFSSKWASELNKEIHQPDDYQKSEFKKYIFDKAKFLKHIYLAGGEPLLMKENLELLDKVDPSVSIRINTNLSYVDSKVFDRICEFKNVHWTVSVETVGKEFEYIRYGGNWNNFVSNLNKISSLGHKITFNMLHFLLNYKSIFQCVDYLRNLNFHPNSFVIGALLSPVHLDIRQLPFDVLDSVKDELVSRIAEHPGFLLENSYNNLLRYIQQPFQSDLQQSFRKLAEIDTRRGVDSSLIFKDLYKLKTYDSNY